MDGGLKIASCVDIEALYNGERVPALSEQDLGAILAFLGRRNCMMIAGGLVFDNLPRTAEVKGIAGRFCNSSLSLTRSFYGPYLLNGKYMPNGIGIWSKEIR